MNAPTPPVLTVRYDGSERSFAAGNDVVVRHDVHADVRVVHPLIFRAHLVLRFDAGKWMAIDNGSRKGTFVNGQLVPVIDIRDGQHVNIGNPDGPCLTFEVGHHEGPAAQPPATTSRITAQRAATGRSGCRSAAARLGVSDTAQLQSARQPLAAHAGRVAVRHGHARRAVAGLRRLCSVAAAAQAVKAHRFRTQPELRWGKEPP